MKYNEKLNQQIKVYFNNYLTYKLFFGYFPHPLFNESKYPILSVKTTTLDYSCSEIRASYFAYS